jgi:hypothetical protein
MKPADCIVQKRRTRPGKDNKTIDPAVFQAIVVIL